MHNRVSVNQTSWIVAGRLISWYKLHLCRMASRYFQRTRRSSRPWDPRKSRKLSNKPRPQNWHWGRQLKWQERMLRISWLEQKFLSSPWDQSSLRSQEMRITLPAALSPNITRSQQSATYWQRTQARTYRGTIKSSLPQHQCPYWVKTAPAQVKEQENAIIETRSHAYN